MQNTSHTTSAAPSAARSQIKRAIDWRAENGQLADEYDMKSVQPVLDLIKEINPKLLGEDFFAKNWKRCLAHGYHIFRDSEYKQVSMEMAVYHGLKRICGKHMGMSKADWAKHELEPPMGIEECITAEKDEGYADYLHRKYPCFYSRYFSEIRQPAKRSGNAAAAAIPENEPVVSHREETTNAVPADAPELQPTMPWVQRNPFGPNPFALQRVYDKQTTGPQTTATAVPQEDEGAAVHEETPGEDVPNRPLNRFQEAAIATAEARKKLVKEIFPKGLPPTGIDVLSLDQHLGKLEIQIPNNIDHDYCYRSRMKETQALLGEGVRITYISYGDEHFFVLYLAEGYDFDYVPLMDCFSVTFRRLVTYCDELSESQTPIVLPEYLEEVRKVECAKLVESAMEAFAQNNRLE